MVAAKTADDLLAGVQVLAQISGAEGRITSQEVLNIGSAELASSIADLLQTAHGDRWIANDYDQAIQANVAGYRVPSRALASTILEVLLVDSAGNSTPVDEIPASEASNYGAGQRLPFSGEHAYVWRGDKLVLVPTPTQATLTLRIRYPRQPSRLVFQSACAKVLSLADPTVTATAALPATFTNGTLVDLIQGTPHGDVYLHDATLANVATPDFDISGGIGGDLSVGDYVCIAGETCVMPIPEAVYPFLEALVAHEVMMTIGDAAQRELSGNRVARRRQHAVSLLSPRNRTTGPKVINWHGAMRTRRRGR